MHSMQRGKNQCWEAAAASVGLRTDEDKTKIMKVYTDSSIGKWSYTVFMKLKSSYTREAC